jgi:hypothetical protein
MSRRHRTTRTPHARRLRLAAAVLALSILLGATAAQAQTPNPGKGPLGHLRGQVKRCKQDTSPQHPIGGAACDAAGALQAIGDPAATAQAATQQLGAQGQVDPISGLGIRNPACDRPSEIRDPATLTACRDTGTPEGLYPASNYGFDVFIDTGIDAPTGTFLKGFVLILNGVWLGLIFVLKLVLALLGIAFGLNPFGDGQTMTRIAAAIRGFYQHLTVPWLDAVIVAIGIALAWNGLLKREMGRGIGGTLASIALLLVGMWVVNRPAETVGSLASASDGVALSVIAAPQDGSVSRPTGSYAEAMSGTWARLVEVPFAGLDFSDVRWALGPPPAEAIQKAGQAYCQDVGVPPLLGEVAARNGGCERAALKRFGRPRRVIDLYLRSSPGSPSRQALWQYFDHDAADRYKAKVAAQGGDGALTRLAMLALFGVGLIGAVLLLAWLAIRLFMQAAIAFFLLLVAPLALFFPALGDAGRRAFATWGLTLLGAVVAKVVYAAFLAVVLLGIAILGGVGGATGFLLSAAFAWAIFLKRTDLVGFLSVSPHHDGAAHTALGGFAAYRIGTRLAGSGGRVARSTGTRGGRWTAGQLADRAQATRSVAAEGLRDRARTLADARLAQARETVRRFDGGAAPKHSDRDAGSYQRAQALIARADHNERTTGRRWSAEDLRRFADQDRRLLASSSEPADHVHRIGMARSRFDALQGPERRSAERAIEQAIRRDRQRLGASDQRPGRIAGLARAGRTVAEAGRQRGAEAGSRAEHLRRLRDRRRRSPAHLAARRNLSRGA